jgi:hypothetical protein
LAIATHGDKMYKFWLSIRDFVFGCGFWTMNNQNPLVANQSGIFMHSLAMSCIGRIASDGCIEQGFF